jgi:PPM family protein phosphatase
MNIRASGGTDPGKKRSNNEDSYLLDDELRLYAVADGIGGSEGGEVASRIAVETLHRALPDLLGVRDRTPPTGIGKNADPRAFALQQGVVLANRGIREAREKTAGLSGMGTTLTAVLLGKGRATVAHVGDSRAYLFRSGKLTQLTNDHALVAEQVRAGLITPEQARMSPYRHVITRALGIEDEVRADVAQHAVQKDDRFLLCTDGLTEMVDDAGIGGILATVAPSEAVSRLIAAANDRGGVDNITAVVVWVTEV